MLGKCLLKKLGLLFAHTSVSRSKFNNIRLSFFCKCRVPPRPRAPPTRATSPENSDSDNGPGSKLQEEDAGNVQDKKKSDTLRKVFSSSMGGGKVGGKGGKGGKGGGKCGIYVEEYTASANTPNTPGGESPYKRPSSQSSSVIQSFPPLTYTNGVPSLFCRIDLSKLPHISQLSRGQQLRQRTELADTRPSSRQTSSHQPPRPPTPEEGEIVDTPPPQQLVSDPRIIHGDGDLKNRAVIKGELISDAKNNCGIGHGATGIIIGAAGASGGSNGANATGSAPKRKRNPSCSSVSSLSTVCSVESKSNAEHKDSKKRKMNDIDVDAMSGPSSSQVSDKLDFLFSLNFARRCPTLNDGMVMGIEQQVDIQPTNHEREENFEADLLPPPPPPQRVYYSYFNQQNEVLDEQDRW